MKCVAALSTSSDPEAATAEVLSRIATGLSGRTADLVCLFASAHHAKELGDLALRVIQVGFGRHVIGCSGESIVGEDREIEDGPALAVWAAELPGTTLTPRRVTFEDERFHGWPGVGKGPNPVVMTLGDPFSFPADRFLKELNESSPGVPVVGGMASASHSPGGNTLVLDLETFHDGAVTIELTGPLTVRSLVSQGCKPVGRSFVVTKAERNIIRDLGGRNAMEVLREVFEDLDPDDQALAQQGLHLGRVINEYQDSFGRGDFLIRNVLGADEAGGVAVTDLIRVGQTVQFHVRDADTADEDLRGLMENERLSRPRAATKGALLFSCNGRGTRLFPGPNHDIAALHKFFGPIPTAGFFAMGELGPIGGQNFVHGYTASVVLFEEPELVGDFNAPSPLSEPQTRVV